MISLWELEFPAPAIPASLSLDEERGSTHSLVPAREPGGGCSAGPSLEQELLSLGPRGAEREEKLLVGLCVLQQRGVCCHRDEFLLSEGL